jgi:histone H3/H4
VKAEKRRDALIDYAERFIVRLFEGSVLLAQHEAGRVRAATHSTRKQAPHEKPQKRGRVSNFWGSLHRGA